MMADARLSAEELAEFKAYYAKSAPFVTQRRLLDHIESLERALAASEAREGALRSALEAANAMLLMFQPAGDSQQADAILEVRRVIAAALAAATPGGGTRK